MSRPARDVRAFVALELDAEVRRAIESLESEPPLHQRGDLRLVGVADELRVYGPLSEGMRLEVTEGEWLVGTPVQVSLPSDTPISMKLLCA